MEKICKKIEIKLRMILKKLYIFTIVLFGGISLSGCGIVDAAIENTWSAVGLTETGTVISQTARIRSSFAVVAADLLEVKRNETVEILNETTFEKVLWYRVRAFDEDSTEGWIEAQHIIKGESLEKSKKLAEKDQELQPQATGKLRASSNLRLTPEQNEENILLRLDNGANFDILDWKYVPKAEKEAETENEDIKAAEEGKEKVEKLDEKYDMWYKVRLDPSVSPAPTGWIYGRQVELQVPGDIVYYQTNNRKFVTWQKLDDIDSLKGNLAGVETDVKVTKPGSWVILSRTNDVKAIDGEEPDFDGILILGFDKYNEEHYTVYSTARARKEVWGQLPLKVEGVGDNKNFTVKLRNEETGEMEDVQFDLYKDANKRLRTKIPAFLEKKSDDKKK